MSSQQANDDGGGGPTSSQKQQQQQQQTMNISRPGGGEDSERTEDDSCTRNYGAAMIPLDDNFEPGENDVLCGRGKKCYASVGNDRFRKLVESRLEEYSDARTKVQKSNIVTQVLHEIRKRSPNGGFVKKDPATGKWFEVGDFVAREKSTQAFRDALHDRYRSSNQSKKRRRKEELTKAKATPGSADGASGSNEDWMNQKPHAQNPMGVPSLASMPPMFESLLSASANNSPNIPRMRIDDPFGGQAMQQFRRLSGMNESISVPPHFAPDLTNIANQGGDFNSQATLQQRLNLAHQLVHGHGGNIDAETLRQRLDLAQQLIAGYGSSSNSLSLNDSFQQGDAYASASNANMFPHASQAMAAAQFQRQQESSLDSGAQASINLGGNGMVANQSYSTSAAQGTFQMGNAMPSNQSMGALMSSNSARTPEQSSSTGHHGSMANSSAMWSNQSASMPQGLQPGASNTNSSVGIGFRVAGRQQQENPFEPVPLAEDVSRRHEARQWGSGDYPS